MEFNHRRSQHRYQKLCGLLAIAIVFICPNGVSEDWYVSPHGSDQNNGLSTDQAFKSPQKASALVQPGDTVHFMEGIYHNRNFGSGNTGRTNPVMTIKNSGEMDNEIVFKNLEGHDPVFVFDGTAGILINSGINHISIKGLKLIGPGEQFNYSKAIPYRTTDSKDTPSGYRSRGIVGWGPHHHLHISNCHVKYTGGSGIRFNKSDYVTIENCTVEKTCWWSSGAESAIVLAESLSIDDSQDKKMIMRNNTVFDNWNQIPFYQPSHKGLSDYPDYGEETQNYILDGQGIYVTRSSVDYNGTFLIENNICFNNGKNGINVDGTPAGRAIITHNTLYNNGSYDLLNNPHPGPNKVAGIAAKHVGEIIIANNIVSCRSTSYRALTIWDDSKRSIFNNIFHNGSTIAGIDESNISDDPIFEYPTTDLQTASFKLSALSPAIGIAHLDYQSAYDYYNTNRAANGSADLGAIEYKSSSNEAPYWAASEMQGKSAIADTDYQDYLSWRVADTESDQLTFSLISGPSWLQLANPQTGLIKGQPTLDDLGTARFTFAVTDGINNATHADLIISVLSDALEDPSSDPENSEGTSSDPVVLWGQPVLKDAFETLYHIGASDLGASLSTEEREVLSREFSVVTPENAGKWDSLQKEQGKFTFWNMDQVVQQAEANGQDIVGHVLVWGSQVPSWIFQDGDQVASRELVLQRMQEHISTVVGRYKGRIKYWDVVNEAFLDNGSLRNNKWRQTVGDDYIKKAFEFAHKADPDAQLIYNDFNMYSKNKVDAVVNMINTFKNENIRIDGIGLQGHWQLDYPHDQDLRYAFDQLSATGVRLHVSELDITVLPYDYTGADLSSQEELNTENDPYSDGIPDEVLQQQADRYAQLFSIFYEYKEHVERVTFWGVSDGSSWKNDFPTKGRTDYALIFDRDNVPKPAYHSILSHGQQASQLNSQESISWETQNFIVRANIDEVFSTGLRWRVNNPDNLNLQFKLITAPDWLTMTNSTYGKLEGTPSSQDLGDQACIVEVFDGVRPPLQATLNIKVSDPQSQDMTETTQQVTSTEPETYLQEGLYWSSPSFSDLKAKVNEPSCFYLKWTAKSDDGTPTFKLISAPKWLSMTNSSTAKLVGTPTKADEGLNTFIISVEDGINPSIENTMGVFVEPNASPEFSKTSVDGREAVVGSHFTTYLNWFASDAENDPLVYDLESGPSWITLGDAVTGMFQGLPTEENLGANPFTISVSDGINNKVMLPVTVHVYPEGHVLGTHTTIAAKYVSHEDDPSFIDTKVIPFNDPSIHYHGIKHAKIEADQAIWYRHNPVYFSNKDPEDKSSPPMKEIFSSRASGGYMSFKTDSSMIRLQYTSLSNITHGGYRMAIFQNGELMEQKYSKGTGNLIISSIDPGEMVEYKIHGALFQTVALTKLEVEITAQMESVEPPKRNGTYIAVGDSISFGTGQKSSVQTWPYLVSDNMNLELYNLAIGGSHVTPEMGEYLREWNQIDLITVLWGYNDWVYAGKTPTVYKESMNDFLDQARMAHPNTPIFVLKPLKSKTTVAEQERTKAHNLDEYRKVLTDIVTTRRNQGDSSLYLINSDTMTTFDDLDDVVHLNPTGAKNLADQILIEIGNKITIP